jgi:hypothetical protein
MEQIQKSVNVKKMIIMGIMGFFVGLILALPITISAGSNYSIVTIIILIILFGFWGSKMKSEESKIESTINQEGLSGREKVITWIFSLMAPLIAGGVLYYIWIKTYPKKAKQANIISWIVFAVYAAIYGFAEYLKSSK